jgi:hypothetical protein
MLPAQAKAYRAKLAESEAASLCAAGASASLQQQVGALAEQVRACRYTPGFPYRRLRIQGDQGRRGLGYRFTVQALFVDSEILL